jgi:hypothetical protein
LKIDRKSNSEKDPDAPPQGGAASGDVLLRKAVQRAGTGLPAEASRLNIVRHWLEPSETTSHSVTYQRDFGSGVHQAAIDGVAVSLDDPVRLLPVEIAKPWGREIWYTGIEARGESAIAASNSSVDGQPDTMGLPLGTYLALAPDHLTNGHTPVLLKILDPLPTPVLGELYLEVHETKQEVYIVTGVDPDAWPDGQGQIRFGINQNRRLEFSDDEAFKAAFLDALSEYETVRREIDDGASGLDEREARARTACLAYTDQRSLKVGDVISVPTWLPHSLQHGVSVVEFQTPTYERFILSSSQKVLTQDRWDSARAIENMRLDTPPDPAPEKIDERCERIVGFEEFGVWQARLSTGERFVLPESISYAVAFCISGQTKLEGPGNGLSLGSGEAALIPAAAIGYDLQAEENCVLLLAAPDL